MDCIVGYYCFGIGNVNFIICDKGNYFDIGVSVCTICEVGYYCDLNVISMIYMYSDRICFVGLECSFGMIRVFNFV